ncbi:aldo/keto reductase [Planosporangium thailandense]|uniref:Aldo/keto reductase n=2 Tax=Planosporangium thailandense TaxID=765197 RepID=A0ABX0XTA8_9ACTN|nr:aldo/keto reductase [Planosporangium thailandense]NJC69231.1 aldo/keto reductase [Planosporangium thailandense]
MAITRVGFGAFAVGGPKWSYGWGAQDDEASIASIRRAVELGVNWIDTAAVYGHGHSEQVVAHALKGLPEQDRPYIFTKGGLVWGDDWSAPEAKVGRPDSLRAELEASLRRLEVDCVDLYQMHWPAEDGTPVEEYWQTLLDLKQEGKARAVGLSNHSPDQLDAAEKLGHVDSLQPPFSAIERGAAADVLPWRADHGTGVIVYSPMQSGLLTGSFSPDRVRSLPADDWRARHPDFTGERLERNLALASALSEVGNGLGVSAGVVAIAWTLAFPGVSGAIVGARSAQQVDGWIAAASLELTGEQLDTIAEAIVRSGAGSGPVRP